MERDIDETGKNEGREASEKGNREGYRGQRKSEAGE
jgi:hypothetical protein